MTDGAAVNTRVQDGNGSAWRENKTVTVFTDKDIIRRKDGSHIITRKEYAAYIGSAEDFRKYVWDIAVRNGYGQVENVAVIADGAAWIRNMCAELFPDAVQILDLFHLKEMYTPMPSTSLTKMPRSMIHGRKEPTQNLKKVLLTKYCHHFRQKKTYPQVSSILGHT